MEFIHVFQKFENNIFLKLVGSIVSSMEKSIFKCHTNPMIIPMIFIFLSWLEKAKKFSCENSKPCESHTKYDPLS